MQKTAVDDKKESLNFFTNLNGFRLKESLKKISEGWDNEARGTENRSVQRST